MGRGQAVILEFLKSTEWKKRSQKAPLLNLLVENGNSASCFENAKRVLPYAALVRATEVRAAEGLLATYSASGSFRVPVAVFIHRRNMATPRELL